jgi:hypothetical protein
MHKPSMRFSVVACAAAVMLASTTLGAPQGAPWKVGQPAPHVHLPDIRTGEAIDLAQYRGRKVLIAEFASW